MAFPEDVPVLSDGVVTLRAHHDGDIDAMVEMCSDPEFIAWTSIPTPYDKEMARGFIDDVLRPGWDRHNHRGWAIEYVAEDGIPRFGGNLDIRGVGVADVGYGMHPAARGRGLMTRALRLALGWAFENDVCEIVHWRARVGNVASLRVAWHCGFTIQPEPTPGLLYERSEVFDAWTAYLRPGVTGPRTPWWDAPVLSGDRVRLRPLRDGDAHRIVEACSDPVSRHWLATMPSPYTTEDAYAFLNQKRLQAATGADISWCVADPESDELLGHVAVLRMSESDSSGEIGYWAHPAARGRGCISEAVRLAVDHAFTSVDAGGLGRRRLELHAAAGNTASNAIARSADFTLVGTQRAANRLGDASFDDLNSYDRLA